MKTKLATLLCGFALLGATITVNASFVTLDLQGNSTLSNSADIAGFPLGVPTYLGGVPFLQNNSHGQVWNAALDAGVGSGSPVSHTLSVSIPNATGFYSLINTWWGQDAAGGSFASLTFNFGDGSSFTKDLYGNQDIRDFNNPWSMYTTTINGTTTLPVYQNTSGAAYYIDRQWFDFSLYGDSGKTLTSVVFNDTGAWLSQRYLVSGATVQSGVEGQVTAPMLTSGEIGGPVTVPEPSTWAMSLVAGLGGLLAYRRRR